MCEPADHLLVNVHVTKIITVQYSDTRENQFLVNGLKWCIRHMTCPCEVHTCLATCPGFPMLCLWYSEIRRMHCSLYHYMLLWMGNCRNSGRGVEELFFHKQGEIKFWSLITVCVQPKHKNLEVLRWCWEYDSQGWLNHPRLQLRMHHCNLFTKN